MSREMDWKKHDFESKKSQDFCCLIMRHECQGWIDKSVLRVSLASRGLPSNANM